MLSAQARAVADDLGLGAEHAAWLAQLDTAGDVDDPADCGLAGQPAQAASPGPNGHAREILARAGVSADDAAAVIATRPDLDRSPALGWLLGRCSAFILKDIGDAGAPQVLLPQLPAALGTVGRCFPAHLFLAVVPATLEWQRRRGIPAEASWAIFADLGRQMAIYRDVNRVPGVEEPWWLMLHLRGLIYEFGRLQFNLVSLGTGALPPGNWYDDGTADRLGTGFRPGDDALGVHIPETGPLTPASCDESLDAARTFFDSYFPSPTRRVATCESWLLDDQLAGYLPAWSNIVRFQRRFTLTPTWSSADKDIAQFVFQRAEGDLAGVPQRTALQRALVTHLDSGRHWRLRCGWLKL